MNYVVLEARAGEAKPDGAIDSSVLCSVYMREHCMDLLRERACELGRHRVVTYSEQTTVTAAQKPRGAKALEVRAWISTY